MNDDDDNNFVDIITMSQPTEAAAEPAAAPAAAASEAAATTTSSHEKSNNESSTPLEVDPATSSTTTTTTTESSTSNSAYNSTRSILVTAPISPTLEQLTPSLCSLSPQFFLSPPNNPLPSPITSPSPTSIRTLTDAITHLETLSTLSHSSPTTPPPSTPQNIPTPLEMETPLLSSLTTLLLNQSIPYPTSHSALTSILTLGSSSPRRVCQHPFRKNDIVWVCRTCQSDETCVLCHDCFSRSKHENHDVAFYHAQAGGCCDCGDPDAWDPKGFCDLHGGGGDQGLERGVVMRGEGIVRGCMDWIVGGIAGGDCERGAEEWGRRGREEGGLFLVLQGDDVHSPSEIAMVLSELYNGFGRESLLSKIIRLLKVHGDLVLYGTSEAVCELGPVVAGCWHDGDAVATQRTGQLFLEKKEILTSAGLVGVLKTRHELIREHRAIAVLMFLSTLARSCDVLCQVVAQAMDGDTHLIPMLRADLRLSKKITSAWHALLLTLLAVPSLKANLAGAYCDIYSSVTKEYALGVGVLDCSLFTLSVQFLNRQTYVMELAEKRMLLERLVGSLLNMLRASIAHSLLDPMHPVLTNRRYSPCISDLKCVLNVKGMARVFCVRPQCLNDWIETLTVCQGMDRQIWRSWSQGPVEMEPRGWVGAFNASISLGSLFERILAWEDDDICPLPTEYPLKSCAEMACLVLRGLGEWQESVRGGYAHTTNSSTLPAHARTPASLPMTTITSKRGLPLALTSLPVSQITPWSFHYPLHRFAAACLREVTRRADGLLSLESLLQSELPASGTNQLFRGLMEFPLLVLSRSGQIRAGLWKRNGAGMQDQVLNYAEPPFCRALRDADLLLLQYALRHSPESTATFVNLCLHRFGIFDFLGFGKAPNGNINLYRNEVKSGLYQGEDVAWKNDHLDLYAPPPLALPWTYSPARGDTLSSLTLLEEFLHLLIILITELPPPPSPHPIIDAKLRLRREVIHRLASGPRTHSELAEVHHVLPQRDNARLSEEGKRLNPDDATGAALETTLADVATLRPSKTFGPHQWELKTDVWNEYDPAFFHASLRCHESAAEKRPVVKGRAYAPPPPKAHEYFGCVRVSLGCDASVIAMCYRVLHVHLTRGEVTGASLGVVRGKNAYEKEALSETALARTVHFLTLGLYALRDQQDDLGGGMQPGSLFYGKDGGCGVTLEDYIEGVFLAEPQVLMDCDWYKNSECALLLLRRLAWEGTAREGLFTAQDTSVKEGAKWICETCASHSEKAKTLLRGDSSDNQHSKGGEADLERRKREARQKAMEAIKAKQQMFADTLMEEGDDDSLLMDDESCSNTTPNNPSGHPHHPSSSASSQSSVMISSRNISLLKSPPRCVICIDDQNHHGDHYDQNHHDQNDQNHHSSPNFSPDDPPTPHHTTPKTNPSHQNRALAFCGHAQASTVLKGSGPIASPTSIGRRFVGTHVALCGHAVHVGCCDSYLASVAQREGVDRLEGGRRGEFRCPLCQRLSNVLIPFIDVGLDWVESRGREDMMDVDDDDDDDDDDESMEEDGEEMTLGRWMENTTWNDDSGWDGRCCFYAPSSSLMSSLSTSPPPPNDDGRHHSTSDQTTTNSTADQQKVSRKSISFGKKDLVAAWNSVMKTPRFRRKSNNDFKMTPPPSGGGGNSGSSAAVGAGTSSVSMTASSSERGKEASSGVTEVWRRLMDQISDVSHRADWKRLGEDELMKDYGEFRHYLVEKSVYNSLNRSEGRETVEWPACISRTLTDTQKNELSREKLISKLLLSIQSFTYSACAEAADVRRLNHKHLNNSFHSKFGLSSVDPPLVLLPPPRPEEDDGEQVFDGRIGKLRYLGLSVMAASSAVAREIVYLLFFGNRSDQGHHQQQGGANANANAMMNTTPPLARAPIAFPILCGHVLTHVVAAMCATCGKGRFKNHLLDERDKQLAAAAAVTPMTASDNSKELSATLTTSIMENNVTDDCENFIKMGLLARILQVLMASLRVLDDLDTAKKVLDMVHLITLEESQSRSFQNDCLELLRIALSRSLNDTKMPAVASINDHQTTLDRFSQACEDAKKAAVDYLADAALILQILVPGVVDEDDRRYEGSETFEKLSRWLRMEPLHIMLESPRVRDLITTWYEDSLPDGPNVGLVTNQNPSQTGLIDLKQKLDCQRLPRVQDWPIAVAPYSDNEPPLPLHSETQQQQQEQQQQQNPALSSAPTAPILEDPDNDHRDDMLPPNNSPYSRRQFSPSPPSSSSLPIHSSKKCVPLLGGYCSPTTKTTTTPSNSNDTTTTTTTTTTRIKVLPTSYTDLYAELSLLCPDGEQTALCLICGAVLNAGGKSECTKHAVKCGAGCGIFFLLQECLGLIMHGGKAAYVHSPYVDSHGETPQYRGRPLNLDLDRYDILKEMWAGHLVRERVIAERGNSRQVIIANFY